MGATIHYSGTISKNSQIVLLQNEMEDICKSMDWQYTLIHDANLIGIIFLPHQKCELVQLTFHDNKLCSVTEFIEQKNTSISYGCFTKTQFAGVDTHIAIVNLLKYLEQKYFDKLIVEDESYYWVKADKEKLVAYFNLINKAIATIGAALQNISFTENANAENIADKLEKIISKLNFHDKS